MSSHDFEISAAIFGGYKKKDVESYCAKLKTLLEEGIAEQQKQQKNYLQLLEEKKGLEAQMEKVEFAYRGLWDRCKLLEETVNRQHQLLAQIKPRKKKPFQNLYDKLERLRMQLIGLALPEKN